MLHRRTIRKLALVCCMFIEDGEQDQELRARLCREEIRCRIQMYNSSVRDHLKMTLSPSGVYTGFITVQLELQRPIAVQSRAGPATRAEVFYLPRGAVNTLHISSSNTVRQVIQALLLKVTVVDSPDKFALFKRCRRGEQTYMCKLAEGENPLLLRLVAGPDASLLSFVLREEPTEEALAVQWEAFSVPELCNFLCILDMEEQEQLEALIERYATYRERLWEALRAVGNPG